MTHVCLICGKPLAKRGSEAPPTCERCSASPPLHAIRNGVHIGWLSPGPKEIEARKRKGMSDG